MMTVTRDEYYKKLEEIEEKLDAIRQKYNRPTLWIKDPQYRKLAIEKRNIRTVGYDSQAER